MTFDAVVFDVDGVLVDTDASYTEAVIRTVRHFLVGEAGSRDTGPAVDRVSIRHFRRAGSWNNDWDLSYGLLCWLRSGLPLETAARSGLDDLRKRAATRLPWSWEEVRGVFEEIYNGSAAAARRYGVTPRLHIERGLGADEPVLLRRALLGELAGLGIVKVGIVTGRSAADWAQVAPRLPLPEGAVAMTDDDGHKPDPALLARVVEKLDARATIAVGDTRDDLRMVTSYAATPAGRARPVTPVMLCPPEDEAAYRALGARHFIRGIDDLPSLVRSLA